MYEPRPKVVIYHTDDIAKACKALSMLDTPEDFFRLYDSKTSEGIMVNAEVEFDWTVILRYCKNGTFEIVEYNGEGTSRFMWYTQVDMLEVYCEVLYVN